LQRLGSEQQRGEAGEQAELPAPALLAPSVQMLPSAGKWKPAPGTIPSCYEQSQSRHNTR